MKNTKRCAKCGVKKSPDAFHKSKANRDGLQSYCNACKQVLIKIWREDNYERVKQQQEEYRKTHREERREYNRQWRQKNRDYWRHYQNERLRTDPNYRLRNYIGAAIRKAIKKNRKSAFHILGYSVDDLRWHLESLFQPGMSWQNYGTEWHIDHVVPKSWFNLETENGLNEYEMKLCWSLQNLQPMWTSENLEKRDKHISHINLGQSQITYDQFRVLVGQGKREQVALTMSQMQPQVFFAQA
jgi:hypothetical protein